MTCATEKTDTDFSESLSPPPRTAACFSACLFCAEIWRTAEKAVPLQCD